VAPTGSRSSLDRVLAAAFPLLVGGLLVRMVVTGTYRSYVKASMWPWLSLAALGLLIGAVWELLARRATTLEHRPAVAWLLLLPVVVVLGLAPGALGSSALEGSTRPRAAYVSADGHWAALPRDRGPIDMTIGEFVERTYAGATTRDVAVQLTGFVAPDDGGGGGSGPGDGGPADNGAAFLVVRFRISCCAADAAPVAVRVMAEGAPPMPAKDSWVTITGTLVPDDPAVLEPRFRVTSVEPIGPPSSPYESMVTPK
jgi:uncharacterized repeat protein (TIGR03943 family)